MMSYGDKLESYVRGLESCGQKPETYGPLLVPVVLDKLPIDIRKSIAREHGKDDLIFENCKDLKRLKYLKKGKESLIQKDCTPLRCS